MNHYYAVIFTSLLTENTEGYSEMAAAMEQLAKQQRGYLDFESAHEGIGITISYWESLDAIKQWKANIDHLQAQQLGKDRWYKWYKTRICRVEREYAYSKES